MVNAPSLELLESRPVDDDWLIADICLLSDNVSHTSYVGLCDITDITFPTLDV